MDELDITPEDSIVPVFLDDTPVIHPPELPSEDPHLTLKRDAAAHLMTTFGFTEEMANAVVGL